jgi:hypothetical protein
VWSLVWLPGLLPEPVVAVELARLVFAGPRGIKTKIAMTPITSGPGCPASDFKGATGAPSREPATKPIQWRSE